MNEWKAFPVIEQIRITVFYSMFIRICDRDYAFLGETHDFWECLYVMDGEVCVSADERVYHLSVGQMIFHKPQELHKFHVVSESGASLFIFSFAAEGRMTGWLRDKVFSLSYQQNSILKKLIAYLEKNCVLEDEQAEEGQMEEHQRFLGAFTYNPQYPQMVITYLYQLFLSLPEEGNILPSSMAPDAVLFGKAIRYLNNNLDSQPTVTEVAEHCSISVAGLKRIFKKYAGVSVHKYFLKLKIKMATEMLQEGESVSATADKLGFNGQSYFSKAFKRETGNNPSSVKL